MLPACLPKEWGQHKAEEREKEREGAEGQAEDGCGLGVAALRSPHKSNCRNQKHAKHARGAAGGVCKAAARGGRWQETGEGGRSRVR